MYTDKYCLSFINWQFMRLIAVDSRHRSIRGLCNWFTRGFKHIAWVFFYIFTLK